MELLTIPTQAGNDRIVYECDGTCDRIFFRRDLLTVPTAEGNHVCDDCAKKHFNVPIKPEDILAEPLDRLDSSDIPDVIHNNPNSLEETNRITYNQDYKTITEVS